jgi:hypothetical protein
MSVVDTDFFPAPDTFEWQKAVRLLAKEIAVGGYELSIHPSREKQARSLAKAACRKAQVQANITIEIWSTSPARWLLVIEPYEGRA